MSRKLLYQGIEFESMTFNVGDKVKITERVYESFNGSVIEISSDTKHNYHVMVQFSDDPFDYGTCKKNQLMLL